MSKIACVVAYAFTNKEGSPTSFNMDYYLSTHMPMIDKYWGPHKMRSWEVQTFSKETSLDGSTPPYIVCTTIYWDSVDDLKAALGAPETKETGADVANFSDVYPAIFVSQVAGGMKL